MSGFPAADVETAPSRPIARLDAEERRVILASRPKGVVFSATDLKRSGSCNTSWPCTFLPTMRAKANKMIVKAMRIPSTTLKELKKWVSDDSDLDTTTR